MCSNIPCSVCHGLGVNVVFSDNSLDFYLNILELRGGRFLRSTVGQEKQGLNVLIIAVCFFLT